MMISRPLDILKINIGNILLVSLVLTFCVEGEGQIITDRPDQTESSSTVGAGNLQIESGSQISYQGFKSFRISIGERSIAAPTLFSYRLFERAGGL